MASHATAEETTKLWNMIRDIRFAMMTSADGPYLRSRPMAAAQKEFDGSLWFFVRASSHKVTEIGQDDRVGVSYADPDKQTYVSLSGHATLVRDAAAIKEHWSEILRAWFPNGKDDPDLALLRVDVEQAEYWDAPSSTMVNAFGYVKAALTGKPPHPGENRKVELR
jgi:general stress protein 26